jgi:hypothetical protein
MMARGLLNHTGQMGEFCIPALAFSGGKGVHFLAEPRKISPQGMNL